ncbi:MAG: hypothetical protein ACRDYA_00690 [Egibacteraceae bacterium]
MTELVAMPLENGGVITVEMGTPKAVWLSRWDGQRNCDAQSREMTVEFGSN